MRCRKGGRSSGRAADKTTRLFGFLALVAFVSMEINIDESIPKRLFNPVDAFLVPSRLTTKTITNTIPTDTRTISNRNPNESTSKSLETTKLFSLPQDFLAETISLATMTSGAYGKALLEHPLSTKSLTAGVLCGVGDVVAQNRDTTTNDYNLQRTLRFASKGCFGGILWAFWYDGIDGFLRLEDEDATAVGMESSSLSFYTLTGALFSSQVNAAFLGFAKNHVGLVTTMVSILMEQFIWCPLVYGTFEIPVSTLLNGGAPASIGGEIRTKLNGLLVSNAKVWTLANLIIYNAPLEWRLFLGNVIDIFWQSIVSDVSADCGGPQEECLIVPEVEEEAKSLRTAVSTAVASENNNINMRDPSFVIEKSRV